MWYFEFSSLLDYSCIYIIVWIYRDLKLTHIIESSLSELINILFEYKQLNHTLTLQPEMDYG